MKIKQLFCNHIWKIEKDEHLSYTIRYIASVEMGTYENFANYFICIKCGKTKIEESKRYIK